MKPPTLERQLKLWTIFLVLIPSLLIMAIYTVGQIRIAKQQNLALISQRVSFQEQLIDYWITACRNDVQNLSQSEAFRTLDEQRMKRALNFAQQANKNFDSLSYIDANGYFKISTLTGGIHFPSAIGKPYYQAAVAGKEYISDVVIGRNSGFPIINFSSPVYDNAGNFKGLIIGSVRLTMLETILRDNWIGATGELFIVNGDGTMLTEPRFVNALIAKGLVKDTARMKFKITADAFHNIRLGETGTATWIDYMGDKVIGAYRTIPNMGWTIIGKIKETEVFAPVYTQLVIMTGATFTVVLLILPLATLLTRRIKRPIDWLIVQSHLVGAENYELLGEVKCPDKIPRELGELSDTFVAMVRKIQASMGLLKENEVRLKDLNIEIAHRMGEVQEINTTLEEEIMERQAAQEALRKAHDELIAGEEQLKVYASQLAAANEELAATNTELKSFANIVAHDFRSPMINLKGFSREIADSMVNLRLILMDNLGHLPPTFKQQIDTLVDKDVPDALRFIDTSVDRLSRMIDTLLKLSRVGRRELIFKEIDMNSLVANVLLSYQKLIQDNNIQLELRPMANIETDQVATEQIIGNLVDNAIKYLEPARQGKIVISCSDDSDKFLFSIQDNGRGITEKDQEKIFEVFRRAGRQDVPGEGMGLAYVKTLVRHLGGRVWCESKIGVGTAIKFTVPKRIVVGEKLD